MREQRRILPQEKRARAVGEILACLYRLNHAFRTIGTHRATELFVDERLAELHDRDAEPLVPWKDAQPTAGYSPAEVELRIQQAMASRLRK